MTANIYIDTRYDAEKAYTAAVEIVVADQRVSTSYVQRKLSIGYNMARRLVERMEDEGVVSKPNYIGKRDVLKASI